MKTPAIRKLRQKLAANQPVYGLWVTLESPSIVEMAVALGLDWVVIDENKTVEAEIQFLRHGLDILGFGQPVYTPRRKVFVT